VRLHQTTPGQDPRLGDARDASDRRAGARALRRWYTPKAAPNIRREERRAVWIGFAPLASDAWPKGHQGFEGIGRQVALSGALSAGVPKRRPSAAPSRLPAVNGVEYR
jgi:hypothetical protein